MSIFNTQDICFDCKDVEEKHPRFAEARAAEEAAVRGGNRRFYGIGAPPELMNNTFIPVV